MNRSWNASYAAHTLALAAGLSLALSSERALAASTLAPETEVIVTIRNDHRHVVRLGSFQM
jgi:hypothetical protein